MWDNFILSLEIMAKGMGSIFVVILLLTLIVVIMGKVSDKKSKQQ